MQLTPAYLGRSAPDRPSSGSRILQLAPDLTRDRVAFDAPLTDPVRFREAISALHDIVINDLRYKPRDKTAYEAWKNAAKRQAEAQIRAQGLPASASKEAEARRGQPISKAVDEGLQRREEAGTGSRPTTTQRLVAAEQPPSCGAS